MTTNFGDHPDREYTLVLPPREEGDGDDSFDEGIKTVSDMETLAVASGHGTTATVVPLPMTAEEMIEGVTETGEMDVFYFEAVTLDGRTHRLMFRDSGVMFLTKLLQAHALAVLENRIRRSGSPEVVNVMESIKELMNKLEREGGDS